jgi:hypothetical protein
MVQSAVRSGSGARTAFGAAQGVSAEQQVAGYDPESPPPAAASAAAFASAAFR